MPLLQGGNFYVLTMDFINLSSFDLVQRQLLASRSQSLEHRAFELRQELISGNFRSSLFLLSVSSVYFKLPDTHFLDSPFFHLGSSIVHEALHILLACVLSDLLKQSLLFVISFTRHKFFLIDSKSLLSLYDEDPRIEDSLVP